MPQNNIKTSNVVEMQYKTFSIMFPNKSPQLKKKDAPRSNHDNHATQPTNRNNIIIILTKKSFRMTNSKIVDVNMLMQPRLINHTGNVMDPISGVNVFVLLDILHVMLWFRFSIP